MFAFQDEVLEWAHNHGKQLDFVVVITRSDNGGAKKKTFLTLGW